MARAIRISISGTETAADEDAVHDCIDGVKQQADHLWNGIFCKQCMGFTLIHHNQSSQSIRKTGVTCVTLAYYTVKSPGGAHFMIFYIILACKDEIAF